MELEKLGLKSLSEFENMQVNGGCEVFCIFKVLAFIDDAASSFWEGMKAGFNRGLVDGEK